MKYTIINGSHRIKSESLRIATYIEERIQSLFGAETFLLSLEGNPLPLWDESIWTDDRAKWDQAWSPLAKELQSSDAVVVVAPEWGGMVPSGLKNLFLLCGNQELGHKPGLIVGVSGSRNGAYPVAELRMSSYKNNHLNYIPDHVIVRNAAHMFGDSQEHSEENKYTSERLDYSLKVLTEYGKALKQVRESGVLDFSTYANGM